MAMKQAKKKWEKINKLIKKSNYAEAVAELENLHNQDKKNIKAIIELVKCYEQISNKAKITEFLVKLAKIYSADGMYHKAIAIYKQALSIDPADNTISEKLTDLYRTVST